MTEKRYTIEWFKAQGSKGGKSTKARYPTALRKQWGKKGGRPKKKVLQ